MQSLFHSHSLATHLVDFHNNHQFVVFQIHLVSFSHDVCDLLDHAVARQNIVIAYCRPNCKLHGKKSQPLHASISHTLISGSSSSWIRPGERAHTNTYRTRPERFLMKVRSENFQRHLLETLGAGSTHQCHGCESECESGSLAGIVVHGIFAYRLD